MGDITRHRNKVSPYFKQLFAVSGVVFYMIGTGTNIAYPGVLLQQLRSPESTISLETEHESWIASVLGLALMTGIAISPYSLERAGRRVTNQISTLPCLVGWALVAMAKGHQALLVGRFLQGLGMGLQASSAPVTIAEYSAPNNRGMFLATIAFSFATGMLSAHLFGTLLYWRTAALACGSFYVISLVIITFSPETPPWLAAHGHHDKCRKSFRWLRGYDINGEKELDILLNSQNGSSSRAKEKKWQYYLRVVRKREFYKPTVIMMFLFGLFQISGMTVVPSYTVQMMKEVTNDSIEGYTCMLLVDFVRFFTAVLSCFVVNRYARRTVLFFGSIITVLSLFCASLCMYLRDFGYIDTKYDWIPIVPTLVYMFGKTIGILPIPWAIAGEIFPLAYRSIGSGIAGMFLSIMFFLVVKTAPMFFSAIGVRGTFCFYGISVSMCVGVLYFILPETRGKTLHEIEYFFNGKEIVVPNCDNENDKMLKLEVVSG